MIDYINTPDAPQPAGHYSQATVWQNLIFVAGQLPIVPATGEKLLASPAVQTRQVIDNMRAILQAAGSDLSHLLKVTIYVSDISLWGEINAVYADMMGDSRPARAVVPSRDLHHGFLVEMEGIAVRIN